MKEVKEYKTGYLYKSVPDNDVIYVNNVGDEYILTEAVSPIQNATYDVVVAFRKGTDEFLFDTDFAPKWFAGSSFLGDYFRTGKYADECLKLCARYLDEDAPTAEAFYTGGGIWISGKYIDKNHYYTVCSEYDDCLSLFDNTDEDDANYCCQCMVWSKEVSELNEEEMKAYKELKALLDKTIEEQR